jgi:hypothetical protein
MRGAIAAATLCGQAHDQGAIMHPTKTLALALTTLAAATGGSVALAADNIQAIDDGRGDAKCDSKPCPDLKSAIANPGIFDKSELFYIVTQHNAVQRSRLPRIAINTRGSGASAPEFYVGKGGSRIGVFNATTGRKTGPAEYGSGSALGLHWSFWPSAIGNPSSFGWRVEIVQKGKKIDATPNSGYRIRSLR